MPGAPDWHLAPLEMAWLGRTPAQLCAQLSDPKRNGGKPLAQIQHHLAHDALVGWGWAPGHGRATPPGSQAELGALFQAWIPPVVPAIANAGFALTGTHLRTLPLVPARPIS